MILANLLVFIAYSSAQSPLPPRLTADTLRCHGLIAAPAPTEVKHRERADTAKACHALQVAAVAIEKRFHRTADSITWERIDVSDIDTGKPASYIHFVFAIDRLRPNVFVDLPTYKVRIMEYQ